jgi:hypothetical protein
VRSACKGGMDKPLVKRNGAQGGQQRLTQLRRHRLEHNPSQTGRQQASLRLPTA